MKIIIRWRPLALSGIGVLGLLLRLYGLSWDQGNNFHPDERQIMFHVTTLAWPHSFAQFLDPANSPLNPHFFAYGSFPFYLLWAIGGILTHFFPALGSFYNLTLVGRVVSAVFDSGTILLTGWLGLMLAEDATPGRKYAWNIALLSAALVAFTPLQLQLSHFYAVDTMLLFFVVLTLLGCVALVNTDAPVRWSIVTGIGYGLAMATKFSAAPLAVPLLIALALRWYKHEIFSTIGAGIIAFFTTLVVFLIAMPYALLDFQNFKQQVADQGDLARGVLDLPYVRQFAGTTPFVYEGQNMLLWGMGVTLGLAACAGLVWIGWRTWKQRPGLWLVVLSWIVTYGAITGSFYVKFMRYMLPLYPFLTLLGAAVLVSLLQYAPTLPQRFKRLAMVAAPVVIALVLLGTMFQGLALLNVYSEPNTRVQASQWIYSHIKPGSVLTYEQWDDALPIPVDGHDPSLYQQASYTDTSGQPATGLDLYGDDTTQKARTLANLLPTVNAITMPTDRLDKSIPRLPARYPLTIRYYQLLFSGQLGFHKAAEFTNRPHLLGITLDDSNADESYSVFDHPDARIFVRDDPYPYTPDQLYQKLVQGVPLPAPGAQLSGAQRSLLLTPQQIADNQSMPPLGEQFLAGSISNTVPVLIWWLTITIIGLLAFPLLFFAFRRLRDHGYILAKTSGLLFCAYGTWLLASLHILPFTRLSVALIILLLLISSIVVFLRQQDTIWSFLQGHWRLLLFEELVFSLAFLLFVGIRALNPDLWNPFLGGEKPMELAFLNAVLRSAYMPPLDPWFAGGYINYYYYGYVIIGSLIKITGIVPTTAFNLAIPTLFALTFSSIVALLYSITGRFFVAFTGGYFAALIGNLDGLTQLKGQLMAALAHIPVPAFNYWQSRSIIPFTINEFPFWSFLFADMHPHVIDMPIAMLMLSIIVTLLLGCVDKQDDGKVLAGEKIVLPLLAAFVLGTIACVNTWDTPVYALLLLAVFIVRTIHVRQYTARFELLIALLRCLAVFVGLACLAYLLYLPFYASYQQLYVNGVGLVAQGTSLGNYLTIFGLWLFIALTFFLTELYRWWMEGRLEAGKTGNELRLTLGYIVGCAVVLTFVLLLGVKMLLTVLIILGSFLFIVTNRDMVIKASYRVAYKGVGHDSFEKHYVISTFDVMRCATYLLLLMGLCITLGQEIVYIRDFLDGGDYARMNTVFKFSLQAWFCLAIGGALALPLIWDVVRGLVRQLWMVGCIVLVLGSSVFLLEGTMARIGDHYGWVNTQPPVQSAQYTPTLDGFAFAHSWYPNDAEAIDWLNAHVSGSPVILEAGAPASYQWYSRVSVYTGLPDVLGWADHEGEQRYVTQAFSRQNDITTMYTAPDPATVTALLHDYHVRYIYLGPLEWQAYGDHPQGLQKFDRMVGSTLQVVYRKDGVTIYEVK